jgi:hypothetical protein
MVEQLIQVVERLLKGPAVQTAVVVATVPATAAGLHAVGISTDLDTGAVGRGFADAGLWITLGMAALFGALGGVVAELISLHGNIELPHRARRRPIAYKRSRLADPRYEIDLGILSRLLLGGTAGLALLAIYAPTSATAVVVNALVAGSAATGIFRIVQGRLLGREAKARAERAASKPPTATKAQLSVVRDGAPAIAK